MKKKLGSGSGGHQLGCRGEVRRWWGPPGDDGRVAPWPVRLSDGEPSMAEEGGGFSVP
jgi:hypothetical protein